MLFQPDAPFWSNPLPMTQGRPLRFQPNLRAVPFSVPTVLPSTSPPSPLFNSMKNSKVPTNISHALAFNQWSFWRDAIYKELLCKINKYETFHSQPIHRKYHTNSYLKWTLTCARRHVLAQVGVILTHLHSTTLTLAALTWTPTACFHLSFVLAKWCRQLWQCIHIWQNTNESLHHGRPWIWSLTLWHQYATQALSVLLHHGSQVWTLPSHATSAWLSEVTPQNSNHGSMAASSCMTLWHHHGSMVWHHGSVAAWKL